MPVFDPGIHPSASRRRFAYCALRCLRCAVRSLADQWIAGSSPMMTLLEKTGLFYRRQTTRGRSDHADPGNPGRWLDDRVCRGRRRGKALAAIGVRWAFRLRRSPYCKRCEIGCFPTLSGINDEQVSMRLDAIVSHRTSVPSGSEAKGDGSMSTIQGRASNVAGLRRTRSCPLRKTRPCRTCLP